MRHLFFCFRIFVLALLTSSALAQDNPQGLVIVSLPGGLASDTLTLQGVTDKTNYKLERVPARQGKLATKWLPPGDYVVNSWRDRFVKGYALVSVQAGRVTDLGSLLPIPVGNNDLVLLPVQTPEGAEAVQEFLASQQSKLSSTDTLVWRMSAVPQPFRIYEGSPLFGLIPELLARYENRTNAPPVNRSLRQKAEVADFLAAAQAATPPLTTKAVYDAQGRGYFGAALGQIRVRDANGAWTAVNTGSLHTVTAVAVAPDRMVAGFDNGTVRLSKDGGASWARVAALGQDQPVIDITRIEDRWFLTVGHAITVRPSFPSFDQLTVFASKSPELSDLAKLRDFKVEAEPLVRPSAAAFGHYLYVNANPALWRLDTANDQWRAVTPDTDVSSFQVAPGNGTLAAYRIKGAFSKLFVSTDDGQNWKKLDNPPYVIHDIRFLDAKQGQATRWNTGAFSGIVEVMDYDSGRDAWVKVSEAPNGCTYTLPDATHKVRSCVTRGGNILSLVDGKWVIEYAVE